MSRGGFGSGIGQIRCPSVENKFTDNPSVDKFRRAGRLSGFGRRVVEFNRLASGLFLDFFRLASGL